jgi:hypothetical protein
MEGDKVVLRDRHSLCGFVIMGGPTLAPSLLRSFTGTHTLPALEKSEMAPFIQRSLATRVLPPC